MNRLLSTLRSWRGPGALRTRFEERGFFLHRVYEEVVVSFCKTRELRCDVRLYWDELSREYVASAGLARTARYGERGHRIGEDGIYRSVYLDELDRTFTGQSSVFDIPPSKHPCMYEYLMESVTDGGASYRSIRPRLERAKLEEFEAHNLSSEGWTGFKQGVNKFMTDSALACGFIRENVKQRQPHLADFGFVKRLDNGLDFYFGYQEEGLRRLPGGLPLEFSIAHREVPSEQFYLGDLRYLLPGLEHYKLYDTAESAVLGVHAVIEAFDAFASSF